MFGGGGSRDYEPIPKERRARTLRRIAAFFTPYKLQVAVVLIAILTTSLIGLVNPLLLGLLLDQVIIGQDYSKLNLYVGLMIALPIITGLIGVGQSLPQQRHRPERHAGPAWRAVRPPPGDAAPLLHGDAHGRDPEPARQRRRRRPGGRHRHRELDHQQPRHRDLDDGRDVHPRLAAGAPVPGPDADLPVPDLSRRQGPPRGLDRDAEVARRVDRDDRGDPERVGHPAVEDVRSAADVDRQVPKHQRAPCQAPDPPGDGRALVLHDHRHDLQHHAGVRVLAGRDAGRQRQPGRADGGHDRGLHHAPESTVLPARSAARDPGRDPGLAGAVRSDLRVPRDGPRDRRCARCGRDGRRHDAWQGPLQGRLVPLPDGGRAIAPGPHRGQRS